MFWIIEAILLGISLSMDAFAVGLTNGLEDPYMNKKKTILIALMFGIFQGLMPLLGYLICLPFESYLRKIIPLIGFGILLMLGISMIIDGIKKDNKINEEKPVSLSFFKLFLEAIATSIDALLVGILFIGKDTYIALISFLIFTIITFILSIIAVIIGKKFGNKFKNLSKILGGIILLAIAIKTIIEYFL